MKLLQKDKNKKAISGLTWFRCSHLLCLMVIFMLVLVHSLRNNICIVSVSNRLIVLSLSLSLCLSLSLSLSQTHIHTHTHTHTHLIFLTPTLRFCLHPDHFRTDHFCFKRLIIILTFYKKKIGGSWTQGLTLAKLLTLGMYFLNRVSCLCSGWPQTAVFPISTFQITRVTGLNHCTWPGSCYFYCHFPCCLDLMYWLIANLFGGLGHCASHW
jgi:hypothetical protein